MPLPPGVLPPPTGEDITSLVDRVRLMEMLPESDVTFSRDDLITLMDQELRSTIIPAVTSVRQEYMVVTADYTLPTQSGNQTDVGNWIEIPSEATGLRLRDVYITDNYGNYSNIPRLNPEQIASWTNISWATASYNWQNGRCGFYLQGTRLMIYPWQAANGRPIRITYFQQPGMLTQTTNCAQIINIIGNDVTLGPTTASWTTSTYLDAIDGSTPHNYVTDVSTAEKLYQSANQLRAFSPTLVSGSTLTFDPTVVASLSVGDWLAPYGYSPFAQAIPSEFVPVLCQATAARALQAAGDRPGQQAALVKLAQVMKDAVDMIAPRVIGKTQTVTNTNSLASMSRNRYTRVVY